MADVTEPVKLRCMHSSDAAVSLAGGCAQVWRLPEEGFDAAAVAAMAASISDCVAVFIAGSAGRYRVESFDPDGNAIRFCGHGALAAALHVYSEFESDAPELDFFNHFHQWKARRPDSADADITLVYKLPELTRCRVPTFAHEVLGAAPVKAADVGGAEDYLVVEFASPDHVRDLAPDFDAFSAVTRRAIIATARAGDPGNRSQKGIVFRYFAPQYGQHEDAATGSAAVQLGAYWAEAYGAAGFSARQLSAGGARMQVVCRSGAVELSARVAYGN